MDLRCIRDMDKREVDFVILQDGKPVFAVESKSGDSQINPSIRYFRERTNISKFYQVHLANKDYGNAGTFARVIPFHKFCKELQLP